MAGLRAPVQPWARSSGDHEAPATGVAWPVGTLEKGSCVTSPGGRQSAPPPVWGGGACFLVAGQPRRLPASRGSPCPLTWPRFTSRAPPSPPDTVSVSGVRPQPGRAPRLQGLPRLHGTRLPGEAGAVPRCEGLPGRVTIARPREPSRVLVTGVRDEEGLPLRGHSPRGAAGCPGSRVSRGRPGAPPPCHRRSAGSPRV